MNNGLGYVKWIKASVLLVLGIAVFSQATALDINSTTDLRYFPDSNMEFSVDTEGNLNMTGDNITNFFDQGQCGDSEAVKQVYPNGSYECVGISEDMAAEGLSQTLEVNNTANQSINIDGNGIDNVSELNPSGGDLILGSNLTLGSEGAFARVNRITSKPVSPMYDSWDDGDIEEYQTATGGVSGISTTRVTSGVKQGEAATQVSVSSEVFSATSAAIYQEGSDGPERGDKFQGYIKAGSTGGPAIAFGLQPESVEDGQFLGDGYELDFDFGNDNLTIDNGYGTADPGSEFVATTNVDLVRNNYYRYVIDWKNNGTIDAELFNVSSGNKVAEVSGYDTNYSSGAWGVYHEGGTEVDVTATYDGFEILSSEDIDIDSSVDFENNSISEINEVRGFFNQTQCDSDEAIKTVYPNGSYSCNTISSTTGKQNLSQTLETGNSAGDYNIDMAGESVTGLYGITGKDGVIRVGSDLDLGNNKLIFGGGNISGGISFNSDILMNGNDIGEIGFLNPSGSSTNFGGNLNVGLNEINGLDSVRFSRGIDLGEGAVTGQEDVQPASSFITDTNNDWNTNNASSNNVAFKNSNLQLEVTGDTAASEQNVSLSGNGGDMVEGPDGYLYLGSGQNLAKYDKSGNLIWSESVPGTVDGLAMNGTSIYASTVSSDYLLKYSNSGNQYWNRSLFGDGSSVGADQDAVYVASGDNVSKYSSSGGSLWNKTLNETDTEVGDGELKVTGIASNRSEVYVTTGELTGDTPDSGYLYKLDTSGNKIWNYSGLSGITGEVAIGGGRIYTSEWYSGYSVFNNLNIIDSSGNVEEEYEYYFKSGAFNTGAEQTTDIDYRDGNVYFVTNAGDFFKIDLNGNKKFERAMNGVGQGVVASSSNLFVSTKNVDELKIFENVVTYATGGDYSSTGFNAGSVQPFSELNVENVLPSATDANVTVELSNSSDFSSSVSKKLELTGGTENQLLDTNAQYAQFDVSMTGDNSATPQIDKIEIKYGNSASAYGYNQIALGTDANTNAEGAVAIGYNSSSNKEYLARFGNNNGQELSAEVTGNLTVDGEIQNFFDQGKCGPNEAVKTVYPNGSYACNQLTSTTEAENLSETLEAGNVANQTIEFENGIAIGGPGTGTFDTSVSLGEEANSSAGSAVSIGQRANSTAVSAVAIGRDSEANGGDSVSVGSDTVSGFRAAAVGSTSTAAKEGATALGPGSIAGEEGSVAIGYFANAPNPYEATFGHLGSQPLGGRMDVNITGNLTVHQGAAFGDNQVSGLSSGDINASDIYYDTLTAKSPVVQCSAGTDWCKVSEPEKQSTYFVKIDESFDKDRPRETAVEVVESDVETIERFQELEEENREQERKIEQLNETVQGLKSVVCENNPESEVCS